MDKMKLLCDIEKIDSEIKEIIYDGRSAIYDGIVNIDEYLASEIKIMWILKEVHSVGDNGKWDLRDALNSLKNETQTAMKYEWTGTFNPIVYITYGILNEKYWEEIPNTWDDPEIIDILNKIAFVNLKKVSGNSVANHNELFEYHNKYHHIIKMQIEAFCPDVIICGNTLEIFDFFGTDYKENKEDNMIYYYSDKHIIIDAYHPNNRKLKQQVYCDSIIKNTLDWKKKFKK